MIISIANKASCFCCNELKVTESKSEESKRIIAYPNMVQTILTEHKKKQNEIRDFIQNDYANNNLVICQVDGNYIDPSSFSKSL